MTFAHEVYEEGQQRRSGAEARDAFDHMQTSFQTTAEFKVVPSTDREQPNPGRHRRTRSATHTKTMAPSRISTRSRMRSGNQSRPKNNR